jgi:hypothetical protein
MIAPALPKYGDVLGSEGKQGLELHAESNLDDRRKLEVR